MTECKHSLVDYDEDDDFVCVLCGAWKRNPNKPRQYDLPDDIQRQVDARKEWG